MDLVFPLLLQFKANAYGYVSVHSVGKVTLAKHDFCQHGSFVVE